LLAVENVLETHARRRLGLWRITLPELKRCAVKTSGGDPEAYFSWEQERMAEDGREKCERDDWIDWCYQMGLGRTPSEVAYWWTQFQKLIAEKLLTREEPVDFGYFELHCVPYRLDWKSVLTEHMVEHGMKLGRDFKRIEDENDILLFQSGLRENLSSPSLLSFDRHIYRHIELRHKQKWYSIVKKVELEKLAKYGLAAYTAYTTSRIRKRIKDVFVPIFKSWLSQVVRPSAAFAEGDIAGSFCLVPASASEKIFRRGVSTREFPVVAASAFHVQSEFSSDKNIFEKNPDVPAMPVVGGDDLNLRGDRTAGGVLGKQQDASEGHTWLQLPHGDKSVAQNGDVLGEKPQS
jgi:hypothetical protein